MNLFKKKRDNNDQKRQSTRVRSIPPGIASTSRDSNTTEVSADQKWLKAKEGAKLALTLLDKCLGGVPLPGKGAFPALLEVINVIEKVHANEEAFTTLDTHCKRLQETIVLSIKGQDSSTLPPELIARIGRLAVGLQEVFQNVVDGKSGKTGAYLMGDKDASLINEANTSIDKLLQRFILENHISGNIINDHILRTVKKQAEHTLDQTIRNLNPIDTARYNSYDLDQKPSCFEDTRAKVMNEISNWISSDDGSQSSIFVLDGVAGIGKSTISLTIARRTAQLNCLGASFFFSRNKQGRTTAKSFVPTLVYQLARYDKEFAKRIGVALEKNPDAVGCGLCNQYLQLIAEPLREEITARGKPVLILIDALDECEKRDAVGLLTLLADEIHKIPHPSAIPDFGRIPGASKAP